LSERLVLALHCETLEMPNTFSVPVFSRLADLLAAAPKAELHVHIEGTLEAEMAFVIADRNAITLPFESPAAMRKTFGFTSLQSFLDVYYAAASVLRTEEDFFDLAWAYFLRIKNDNVVHAEIFFDPQTHTSRGVAFQTVAQGLCRAIEKARCELGISAMLILCFLRHLSQREAFETLEQAQPFLQNVIAVGLDSSERGNPAEKFTDVFAACRRLGLHAVAHAGEEGPAASITNTLECLHVERIDHGVACLKDKAVVNRLVREQIPLTVCPLSNVKLRVFGRMADHNLPQLLDAGLRVSVHSDDPAYFGGYLNHNLLEAFSSLPLSATDAYTLLRNSFQSSFLQQSEKERHISRLSEVFAEQRFHPS